MAEYVRRRWEPRFEGMTRRDRQGCSYDAYLPDLLAGWNPTLPGDLAADIADAETAIRDLNEAGTSHVSLEGLARFLLRAESVASSKIEGLDAGPRQLVEAEAVLAQRGESTDRVAVEVLGNIAAMESAIELALQAGRILVSDLLEIHRVLMERSPRPELGGVVRARQNWIGGSPYDPCSAVFVPPPPEQVYGLFQDLIGYVNGDEHSPLTQAAIAHAQFETIHPFADGNGRSGRALIHVILRRRGLSPAFVPPISLALATWSDDYISGLTAFRHTHPADSPERSLASHTWLRTFAGAILRACSDARIYATRIDELVHQWRSRLGTVRKRSALDLLIDVLPGVPLLTVASAARLIGRSDVAAGAAVNRLADAGILRQRNVGKQRYRIFETPDVLDLFTSPERALASPTGDTATDEPVRPVPQRQPTR
ncbi:MAG: Fic family protein [Gammaproteobacteria bacterium]|nr:Fic family protein [Gammaproteobacteria bacterium]